MPYTHAFLQKVKTELQSLKKITKLSVYSSFNEQKMYERSDEFKYLVPRKRSSRLKNLSM